MKIYLLNETIIPLPFFSQVNNIISFFSRRKKTSISSVVCFWENKGIMLQTLWRKQKYQVTNVGVEKIKLSRFLVQRINEFKMSEIQRKTPQQSLKPSWQTAIVSCFRPWTNKVHTGSRWLKNILAFLHNTLHYLRLSHYLLKGS